MSDTIDRIPGVANEISSQYPVDWVDAADLPENPYVHATGNKLAVLDWLVEGYDLYQSATGRSQLETNAEIARICPNDEITAEHNIGIDVELILSEMRRKIGQKASLIRRMGKAFKKPRDDLTPEEQEADAVNKMGLDASLYSHGAEQARRGFELTTMQQVAHQKVFKAIYDEFGRTQTTIDLYTKFCEQVPNFTARGVKYLIICGLIHDYGEIKTGDIPWDEKQKPSYTAGQAALEVAAGLALATEVHHPLHDPELEEATFYRFLADQHGNVGFKGSLRRKIRAHLDLREIKNSILGVEQNNYGEVEEATAFAAIERLEYVLSGVRAFEAVEHDFQGLNNDREQTENILRLGASTFFNHLPDLLGYAERYVKCYDFIRQNAPQISRYMDIVVDDIAKRRSGELAEDQGYFGGDPFVDFSRDKDEPGKISSEQAQDEFLSAVIEWQEWQTKPHIIRSVWEVHFGTKNRVTQNCPDVSFLQFTTREIKKSGQRIDQLTGVVRVLKPLRDRWNVGLDRASRDEHEAKAQRAAEYV